MDNKIKIGDTFEYTFNVTQEDVIKFAEATGDYNPIHIDPEFAARSIFKRPIIHGLLGGSVFSKVFGTIFPGEGTIYLKQDMTFLKPMYSSTNYKAVFKVTDIIIEKNRATIETQVLDLEGTIIINGNATVKHPSFC